MSAVFVAIAGVLTALSLWLLVRPLVRRRDDARPSTLTASMLALALLLGGGGLYAAFSDYSWQATPAADTPAAQAAVLAKRLARHPDDVPGWLELGEKYTALEQYPLAARAYARADAVANGGNAEAIIGLAESLLAIDFEDIRGRSGRLFERVLEIEPTNLKGLFYGAIAAFARGETAEGRQRFERLLALNPPANIRAIIEKQLQAIDAQVAGGPAASEAPAPGGDAQIRVRITVGSNLQFQLGPDAALFVLARDPQQPGPPFAAKRLPVQFPVEVTLSAADAMLEQRRITAGQTLDVVARISLGGQPQSASGDPFGQVSYHVGRDGTLNLVIDRLAP